MKGVFPLGERRFFDNAVPLFGGRGFPRKRGFVYAQIFAREYPAIGGHAVSLFEFDNVAHHKLFRIRYDHFPVADDLGSRLGERF